MSAEWSSSLVLHVMCLTLIAAGAIQGAVSADVRLVGGPDTAPNSGRVEIKLPNTEDQEWVAVCGDSWEFAEGKVVCEELGYPDTSTVKASSEFGEGNLMKMLGGFSCHGNETRLSNCDHGNVTSGECGAEKSAIVTCSAPGFKGCFQKNDSSDRLFSSSDEIKPMTIEKCIKYAKDRDSPYAGLEGEVCWIHLKSSPELLSPLTTEGACGDLCSGDINQRCGKNNWYAVYDVTGSYCSNPRTPNADLSIRPESAEFYFGTIINVTCNAGFALQGASTVQCVKGVMESSVMWEDSLPECQDVAHTTPTSPDGTGSNAALILGIINMVLIVILIAILLIWLFFKMRREQSEDKPAPVAPDYEDAESHPPNGRTKHAKKSTPDKPPVSPANIIPTYSVVDKDHDKRSSRSSRVSKANSAYVPDEDETSVVPRYSKAISDRGSAQYREENEEPIFGEIMVSPRRDREEGWVENEMYEAVENPQSDTQF